MVVVVVLVVVIMFCCLGQLCLDVQLFSECLEYEWNEVVAAAATSLTKLLHKKTATQSPSDNNCSDGFWCYGIETSDTNATDAVASVSSAVTNVGVVMVLLLFIFFFHFTVVVVDDLNIVLPLVLYSALNRVQSCCQCCCHVATADAVLWLHLVGCNVKITIVALLAGVMNCRSYSEETFIHPTSLRQTTNNIYSSKFQTYGNK